MFAGDHTSDGQMQPIIDALSSHFTLRTLHLNSVYVEEDAMAAFEALLCNVTPTLMSLTLYACIHDQTAAALATVLTSNSTLRLLRAIIKASLKQGGWQFLLLCVAILVGWSGGAARRISQQQQ